MYEKISANYIKFRCLYIKGIILYNSAIKLIVSISIQTVIKSD